MKFGHAPSGGVSEGLWKVFRQVLEVQLRVSGLVFRVSGFVIRASELEFQVSDFEFMA
jgi:hypothetical protein